MQIQRPGNDMTGRHHRAQRECLVSVEKRGAVVKRLENQKLSLIIVKHSARMQAVIYLFVRPDISREKTRRTNVPAAANSYPLAA
jgi:hypothetical protein